MDVLSLFFLFIFRSTLFLEHILYWCWLTRRVVVDREKGERRFHFTHFFTYCSISHIHGNILFTWPLLYSTAFYLLVSYNLMILCCLSDFRILTRNDLSVGSISAFCNLNVPIELPTVIYSAIPACHSVLNIVKANRRQLCCSRRMNVGVVTALTTHHTSSICRGTNLGSSRSVTIATHL